MRVKWGTGYAVFLSMLASAEKGKCLVWPYTKGAKLGYGSVWKDGRHEYCHRLAWMATFGAIPEGHHVLHHCDNPPCFNPFCLFTGTEKDNRADQKSKGRTLIGTSNVSAKLTDLEVLEIRRIYSKGVIGSGQIALADKFGVTRIAIKKIVNRETWTHL